MSFSFLLITSQQSIKCSGSPRSSLFWAIMHLTVVQSLSQKVQTNVSPLRILNLHSGQVAFVRSQRLMHPQWKWCVQGRRYSSSPSTYGHRQIQHSYNIIRSSSVVFQQFHDAFQLYAKQQRIRVSRFHVVTSLRQFSSPRKKKRSLNFHFNFGYAFQVVTKFTFERTHYQESLNIRYTIHRAFLYNLGAF